MKGFHFYRQKPLGDYIADFYCPKGRLVVEVDGGQHAEDEQKEKDRRKMEYLKENRLKVLRYSNRDVLKSLESVSEDIWRNLP